MARPPFKPTAEQRQLVQKLAEVGVVADDIAYVVPWGAPDNKAPDEKTIRKHFAAQLRRGQAHSQMRLKKRAYEMAMDGDRTMLIFLLKARCGYSETVKVESTGKDGAPLVQLYLPAKGAHEDDDAPTAAASMAAHPPSPLKGPQPADSTSTVRHTTASAATPAQASGVVYAGSIGGGGDLTDPRADPRRW